MANLEIMCIVYDSNGVPLKVGIKNQARMFVDTVISDLRYANVNSYFVAKNRKRLRVYAKEDPKNHNWFLTTDPDGFDEDGFKSLPECR